MSQLPLLKPFNMAAPTLEFKTFNAGQGNCLMIKAPNGVCTLVDAGTTSSSPGAAHVVAQVASVMGSTTFTNVVITHPDADHCNLIDQLPSASSPTNVHISMVETDYPAAVQTWMTGKTIYTYVDDYFNYKPDNDFGKTPKNFDFYVLAANFGTGANTNSMVLLIEYGSEVVILTGDATSSTERAILKNWPVAYLDATVLCFGHHGSNHSSSKKFISATRPEVGVFSASAAHMGYGHPRCSVYDEALPYIADLSSSSGHNLTCFSAGSYHTHSTKKAIFSTADSGLIEYETTGSNWTMTWG